MRKYICSAWLLSAIAVVLLIPISNEATAAGTAKMRTDVLSDSALAASLRSAEPASRDPSLVAARREWQQLAASAPANYSKAEVVTSRGFSSAEIQDLADDHGLDILRVEAKVPVDDGNEVFTFSFGARALEQTNGTLASRIDRAVADARRNFETLAATEKDAARSARYRKVSRSLFMLYKVEAIGSNAAFGKIGRDSRIRAVLRTTESPVEGELQAHIALRQQSQGELAKIGIGPDATSRLISPCDSDQVAATFAGSKPSVVNPCQPKPERPDPPPAPANPPWLTGVAVIDNNFHGIQQYVDTNFDTTSTHKATIPTADYFSCNSMSGSNKCPNDLTFTTRGNTGGAYAWGVGISNYGGTGARWQCGWYVQSSYDYGLQWVWRCDWITVQLRDVTVGSATSTFRFGGLSKSIPVSPGSTTTNNFKVSTFAWSGSPVAYDGSFAQCVPLRGLGQPSAPCDPFTINGNYVDGISGFEDKVVIPNPSCTAIVRSGTVSDASSGCFIADSWVSNLPAAYLDTTALDTSLPFTTSQFVASVGSADGKQLRTAAEIPPGAVQKMTNPALDYYWSISFWAYGRNNLIGQSARHLQAVTARDASAYVCLAGTGNAPPLGPAACMFNVDISVVGPDQTFR
jgi:hypothetical protein